MKSFVPNFCRSHDCPGERTGPSTNHFDSLTGSKNGVTNWCHDGQTCNVVCVDMECVDMECAVPNRCFSADHSIQTACITELPLMVVPYVLHRCRVKLHLALSYAVTYNIAVSKNGPKIFANYSYKWSLINMVNGH